MCQLSVWLHRFYRRGHTYTGQLLQNIPVSYFEKYQLGMNIWGYVWNFQVLEIDTSKAFLWH